MGSSLADSWEISPTTEETYTNDTIATWGIGAFGLDSPETPCPFVAANGIADPRVLVLGIPASSTQPGSAIGAAPGIPSPLHRGGHRRTQYPRGSRYFIRRTDVDVSLRGAAGIARRLQDPLAELVKIDPKSIGVGQYQHDVNQSEPARTLGTVVEDCVNSVGVDLNTASVPLLSRVSGLSGSVAKAVVRWREANGAFKTRKQLLEARPGRQNLEQSAGFLRIRGGDNPLDMTWRSPRKPARWWSTSSPKPASLWPS